MQLSQALAATQTALLASQLNGGFLRVFTGNPPTSPDRAETGTLLGIVSVSGLGGGLHFTSAGNVMSKADERWMYRALATGSAGWFRIVQPGDTGANDLAALRIDGTIGIPSEPGDLQFPSRAVTINMPYTIDSFLYLIQPVGIAP